MSKKNKKRNIASDYFDLMAYPQIPSDKEGDLRFHQKMITIEHTGLFGGFYEDRKGPKILQRFDGKEWQEIPLEIDYDFIAAK